MHTQHPIKQEIKEEASPSDDDIIIVNEDIVTRKTVEPTTRRTLHLKKLIQRSKVKPRVENIVKDIGSYTTDSQCIGFQEPSTSGLTCQDHAYS